VARALRRRGWCCRPRARRADEGRYLDERRLAVSRATALAERHYGDEAIAARLASEGVEADEIAGALVALPSEDLRARRAMAAFTGSLHRRYAALRRRGFSQPAIEAALAELDDQDRPPLA